MKAPMYRFLFALFIVLFVGLLIWKVGFRDLFIPEAVKTVRSDQVTTLRKEAKKAEEEFKKEIETAERVGEAYEKLGGKYMELHDWTPAIEALEKAVAYGRSGFLAHHNLAVAYANRGRVLMKSGDIRKAEKHYEISIEKNPDFYDSRYGLAILKFYLTNEKEEAVDLLQVIISEKKTYFPARFALARVHYEQNRPERALAEYESLYSDLMSQPDSPLMKEYRENCKKNISRLMMELSRKR